MNESADLKVWAKLQPGFRSRKTWYGRTSPKISHIPKYLQMCFRFSAPMGNCTFHRSSTALMGRYYRSLYVITWRKNYVSILLKLHWLDTQSVGRPCIQTEAADIQATVSKPYWQQITYNKVWAALITVMTMPEWRASSLLWRRNSCIVSRHTEWRCQK